jgi:hypothetical protein
MALPALTTHASNTSQLQMTPIFSFNASISALNASNERIPSPLKASSCLTAHPFSPTDTLS